MLIEAKYYQKIDDNKVKCTLCPHECILSLNKTGICKTRINKNGKLFSVAYANPCALSVDPIEKKPLNHFLPASDTFSIATAGCNLSCKNCQNSSISQVSPLQINSYDASPDEVVKMAVENNCKSISYTYTEPVVFYEYALDTAKLAHKQGLKNIIVSSGFINKQPLLELISFIDAANIDLKSFDDKKYKQMSGARLQPVLDSLIELKKAGIWLEITNLLIPTFNDDKKMIKQMCKWLFKNGFENVPLHFSKFYPTYKFIDVKPTIDKLVEEAIAIAKKEGLKYIYSGNIRGNNFENTYCAECESLLVERFGYQIVNNNLSAENCPNCGANIPGVWL